MKIDEGRINWFILSGAARSGTTAFQQYLNTNKEVSCFHEYGLERFFEKINSFFDGESEQNKVDQINGVGAENGVGPIPRRKPHYDGILMSILWTVFGRKNFRAVGDKTPNINSSAQVENLRNRIPGVRFIFVVRNPVSVINSSLHRKYLNDIGRDIWHIRNIIEAIEEWRSSWLFVKNFAINQEDCLVVKYEDMINYPSPMGERIS